jgi:CHAT domain-containing protein
MVGAHRTLFATRAVATAILVPLLAGGNDLRYLCVRAAFESAQGPFALNVGVPISGDLKQGQTRHYEVTLRSGEFANLSITQKDMEVSVVIHDPGGDQVLEQHAPGPAADFEPVVWIGQKSGAYNVELKLHREGRRPGHYEIKLEEVRLATDRDRNWIAAEHSLIAGEELQAEGSLGSAQEAIKRYQEAIPLWRAADDRRALASTLNRIGTASMDTSNYRQAADAFKEALAIWEVLGSREMTATVLCSIAVASVPLLQFKEAAGYFDRGLTIWRELKNRQGEATALAGLGAAYVTSNPQKAIEYIEEALAIWRASGDRKAEGYMLFLLGGIYNTLGDKSKASGYFQLSREALAGAASAQSEPASQSEAGEHDAYEAYNAGLQLMAEGTTADLPQAIDKLETALAHFREKGDQLLQASSLTTLGEAYNQTQGYGKALASLQPALELWRALNSRAGQAAVLVLLGKVHYASGDRSASNDCFQQALDLSRSAGDLNGQMVSLFGLARTDRDRGDLPAALGRMREALSIVESTRRLITVPEWRASYFGIKQDYHEFYIDLLMELYRLQPSGGYDALAFRASEARRSRTLVELLGEARIDIRHGVDNVLLDQERSIAGQLREQNNWRLGLLTGSPENGKKALTEGAIVELRARFEQLEGRIRNNSPRYAALTQPELLSASEIQQLLDPHTLLLEYSLGDDRSYLFTISTGGLVTFELPPRSKLEAAARKVYELLTASNQCLEGESSSGRLQRLALAAKEYPAAAAALGRMLLGPAAGLLSNKRLALVCDGALQYIPFAAIPAPGAQGTRPLVLDHEIINLPSGSVLAEIRKDATRRQRASKTLAVFADAVFSKDDARLHSREGLSPPKPEVPQQTRNLPPLPSRRTSLGGLYTCDPGLLARLASGAQEAQEIASLVPKEQAMSAVGFAATKAAAMSDEIAHYRIVHFATHGVLDDKHPELSGIILSMIDREGRLQDGYLKLQDIYNMRFNAELVVLGACETALGKDVKGEGLIALSRGCIYAGAKSVLASLWSVSDAASGELMRRFYRQLLAEPDMRPAQALRMAQISMYKRRLWQSPYNWGSFVLLGDWK